VRAGAAIRLRVGRPPANRARQSQSELQEKEKTQERSRRTRLSAAIVGSFTGRNHRAI